MCTLRLTLSQFTVDGQHMRHIDDWLADLGIVFLDNTKPRRSTIVPMQVCILDYVMDGYTSVIFCG